MKFRHVQGVGTKARFGWSAIDNPSHFETCLYHRFGIRGYGTSSFLHDFRDTGVSGHAPSAQGNRNFSLVWAPLGSLIARLAVMASSFQGQRYFPIILF